MLEIGSVIGGKYKILYSIGKGGMSRVYLALNERANKQWAVKEVMKNGGKNRDVIRQTLVAETKMLQTLRHPNMPTIIDIIETDESYLILMDYIEGITLLEKLEEEGAQKQEDVVRWAYQICDVLHYLHTRKPPIIYRDMKPSNIMLKPDGTVVLIDFCTAREYVETKEEDTSWLGTRGYAAPEQFGGSGQTDARTDIYALGATMYHLVTGHNPSRYPYEIKPIRKWDPTLSSGLEEIILKCTKNSPEERYQNCEELMYALDHYTELEEGNRKKRRKHLGAFLAAVCAAAAFITAGAVCSVRANSLARNNYQSLIREAESATSEESRKERYLAAVAASPSSERAYIELLDRVYLDDGTFTKEEADELTSVLGNIPPGGSAPAERSLSKNKAGYDEFAYRLGIAYFYYYGGSGNKAMSQPWFEIAMESETLEPAKASRAKRFYGIAEYYSLLGDRDRAGDAGMSYRDYWADLSTLTAGNLVEEDNVRTALVMYRELLYQVSMRANEFRKSGVEESELLAAVDNVVARLDTDFASATEESDLDMIEKLHKSAAEAERSARAAYGEGGA